MENNGEIRYVWMWLKHKLGLHSWSKELYDDVKSWIANDRDGDIAYWRVCELCGKELVIQTRY